jgi:hypothetical protein
MTEKPPQTLNKNNEKKLSIWSSGSKVGPVTRETTQQENNSSSKISTGVEREPSLVGGTWLTRRRFRPAKSDRGRRPGFGGSCWDRIRSQEKNWAWPAVACCAPGRAPTKTESSQRSSRDQEAMDLGLSARTKSTGRKLRKTTKICTHSCAWAGEEFLAVRNQRQAENSDWKCAGVDWCGTETGTRTKNLPAQNQKQDSGRREMTPKPSSKNPAAEKRGTEIEENNGPD